MTACDVSGFPVLSFFTGAGFLDMGFIRAGFRVVWHNEVNPEFARGFWHGMNAWYRKTGRDVSQLKMPNVSSIENLEREQIIREAFGGKHTPKEFGIIGGPPCPDFSTGGKNRGKNGSNGRLSKIYVDRICALRPTFFLFENVPGLIRTAKHRLFLAELQEQLNEHYITDMRLVNALEFGAPQDRERVLFVGFLRSWLRRNREMPSRLLTKAVEEWFPFPKPKYTTPKTRFIWPKQTDFGADGGLLPQGTPRELMVGTYILDQSSLHQLENSNEAFL